MFQIWVHEAMPFKKDLMRIFWVQMTLFKQERLETMGKNTMPGSFHSFHWFKGRHKHKHNTTHFVMKSMQRQYFSTIFEN